MSAIYKDVKDLYFASLGGGILFKITRDGEVVRDTAVSGLKVFSKGAFTPKPMLIYSVSGMVGKEAGTREGELKVEHFKRIKTKDEKALLRYEDWIRKTLTEGFENFLKAAKREGVGYFLTPSGKESLDSFVGDMFDVIYKGITTEKEKLSNLGGFHSTLKAFYSKNNESVRKINEMVEKEIFNVIRKLNREINLFNLVCYFE